MKKIFIIFIISQIFLQAQKPNHLLGQSSPYLKQHLYNPVDWYPWGKKAFAIAKKEHKPIFLSIGYSTCHWCHVMEKESFTNAKIAKLLNKYFVCIAVDMEELPNVNKYYQKLYQRVYGKRGGWPLNIFMSENKKPFFISTYIPAVNAYGSKGMEYIVSYLGKAYKDKKLINKKIKTLKNDIKKKKDISNINIIQNSIKKLSLVFDNKYKGFGKKAKYPKASTIRLLFTIYKLNGSKKALKMALSTLKAMSNGSIYDQIGGGFFRYTTDRAWLYPHFEKMLYSNAELIPLYVKAYNITKKIKYKNIVINTLKEFDKHFQSKESLYFSASSADSSNGEGMYYLYKYKNVLKILLKNGFNAKNAKNLLKYIDIQADGNYDSVFALAKITKSQKPKNYKLFKKILLQIREKREFPFIDKKILTSWNSLIIKAKLSASSLDKKYKKEALVSLNKLIYLLQKKNGSLFHQRIFAHSKQNGILEDYAFLINTLLFAYEKTFDKKYLKNANLLTKIAIRKFYINNTWYLGGKFKVKSGTDDSDYTSPASIMIQNILRLSVLQSSLKYQNIATKAIKKYFYTILNNPLINSQITIDYLMEKKGIIAIKSSKRNLLKYAKKIDAMHYPFLLKEVVKSNHFLSCDAKSCFGYGNFKKIKRLTEQYNNK